MSSNPSAAFVSPRSQVRFLGSIVFIDVTLMIDFRHFLVIPTTIIKLPRITTNLVERDLLRHWYNREVVVLPHPTACTTPSHAHCYCPFSSCGFRTFACIRTSSSLSSLNCFAWKVYLSFKVLCTVASVHFVAALPSSLSSYKLIVGSSIFTF